MANFSVIAYEYINFYNDGIGGEEYSESSSSSLSLNDIAQVFDKNKASETDNINIDNITRGLVSRYIKKAIEPGISITDDSNQRVDYRPVLSSEFDVSDDSISHMFTPQSSDSDVDILTRAYIDVNYKNISVNTNPFDFSDISNAEVSRKLTKIFKNASFAFVGTSEETIYTCPLSTVTNIMSISISNILASPIVVSVMIYKSGTDQIYILKDYLMEQTESIVINKHYGSNIILEEDDEIRVISSINLSVDVFISLLEQS